MAGIVTFLSDFGLSDGFVGICHGVIVGACPEAQVIHLGHGIHPAITELLFPRRNAPNTTLCPAALS